MWKQSGAEKGGKCKKNNNKLEKKKHPIDQICLEIQCTCNLEIMRIHHGILQGQTAVWVAAVKGLNCVQAPSAVQRIFRGN